MLLEQLFIRVDTKYDGSGMRRADKDVDELESSVKTLNTVLNTMTAALGTAAVAGLRAFTGWDNALTRLAGKAGVTRREFDKMYGSLSGSIAREVGLEKAVVAGLFQQQHSLGGKGSDLVRMAATLEAAGVATGSDVIENSLRISDYFKLNDPALAADTIAMGSQIGAGDSRDYFDATGRVMQMSEAFGFSLQDVVGTVSVLSKVAPNIREGATQLRAFLTQMNNPSKDTEEGLAAIGLTPDKALEMLREDMPGFFEHLAKFSNEQINALTPGNVESFQFIRGMATNADLLRKNTAALENSSGTIEGIRADRDGAWEQVWKSFKESVNEFLVKFGVPFAKMLTPILDGVNKLIDNIIKLDESTGGLIMWIGALITGMLFLRLAVIAASKAWGLARPLVGGGGILGRGGGAAGGKGGFWKGVAGALGLTQLKEVVKSTAFISTLKRLAGLFRMLTGPIGAIVAVLSAVGLISSKAKPDAFNPEDIDTKELDAQANASWMYAKALLSKIWETILQRFKESFAALGAYIEADALAFFALLFGESNARKIIDSIKSLLSAIAEVFAAVYNVITNPIDSLKLAGKKILAGGLWAIAEGVELAADALGIERNAGLDALEDQHNNPDQSSVELGTGIVDNALGTSGQLVGTSNGGTTISFVDNSNTNVDVSGVEGSPQEIADATAQAVKRERSLEAQRVQAEMGSFASP